jgi:hypothetical protein
MKTIKLNNGIDMPTRSSYWTRAILSRGGNHRTLTAKKGYYYELVKNQLELGN